MGKGLENKKIGIAASRRAEAIAVLVQKSGGIPSVHPIQGELHLNEKESERNVSALVSYSYPIVILTTGIGAETLERAAERLKCHEEFIQVLKNAKLVVRGSKTVNWLKKHHLQATYVSEDGTMNSLLNSLSPVQLDYSNDIFIQLYNEDEYEIKFRLEQLGYNIYLSKPYQYKEPDQAVVKKLRRQIVNRELDSVIFTSKTQVNNLFRDTDLDKKMADSFNEKIIATAVGKVTARQLTKYGINNILYPDNEKMGAMVIELRNYLEKV
ncbi:uroporphyrinogen-III synthase [Oceanobacillus piezotolerans]|uniref:Uroporphyrinogen-III synthase n=1 Tax=Oceanobacillus piezotolerans TaxID=2448030 RepID=A0A498DE03_9BACI|nr:uroporphyrinogen-III synthase [Oceanobacillus piezotolerans]RLL47745.1 uroporphyrinogen-III synthase [Oceanobacillus piezotolerans]